MVQRVPEAKILVIRESSPSLAPLPARDRVASAGKIPTRLQGDTLHRHIPALDGVRGLAVAMVFLVHYGGVDRPENRLLQGIAQISHAGWIGVSLFFALSGFLITGILWSSFEKRNWWRVFYLRRSLRIFPLYYLALAVAIIATLALGAPAGSLRAFWVYAFYLQDLPTVNPLISALPAAVETTHFWSLAVEEQFYLLWPFLLFAFHGSRKAAMRLCVGVFLVSLIFRLGANQFLADTGWSSRFLLGRMGELAAGAYLALSMRGSPAEADLVRKRASYFLYGSAFAFAAVVLWCRSTALYPRMSGLGIAVVSILCASIVAMCLREGWVRSFFNMSFLRWLGKISYGIYVWHLMLAPVFHWMVVHMLPNAGLNISHLAIALIAVPGTLGVASLSFYTYERAFLMLKDRWSAPARVAGG